MSNDLQRIEKSQAMALQFVKKLPYVVGEESLTDARKHLWLAFGRGSPDLFKCSDQSIAYAIALSAMSGLYPGGPRPDVWLIPRRNRGTLECNWQMSSRGYQRMAADAHYRTRAFVVHEHDTFKVIQGSSPSIVHEPDMCTEGTWDTIMCAYITVVSPDGGLEFAVLRKDQIEKRRAKAQHDGIWSEWPEEQTLKTMHAYAGAREMWPTDGAKRFAMAADQKPMQSMPTASQAPALTIVDFDPPIDEVQPMSDPPEVQLPIDDGIIPKATRRKLETLLKESKALEEVVHEYGPPDKWETIYEADIRCYLNPPDDNLKRKEMK